MKTKYFFGVLALVAFATVILLQQDNLFNKKVQEEPDAQKPTGISDIEAMTNTESLLGVRSQTTPIQYEIILNGDGTNTFQSEELNIAFEYPSEWENLSVGASRGNCPVGIEPCKLVWAEAKINGIASSSVFSTLSQEWRTYRRPGGGSWRTSAGVTHAQTPEHYCKDSKYCDIGTNKSDIQYVASLASGGQAFDYWMQSGYVWLADEHYPGIYFGLVDSQFEYDGYETSKPSPEAAKSSLARSSLIDIVESVRTVQ